MALVRQQDRDGPEPSWDGGEEGFPLVPLLDFSARSLTRVKKRSCLLGPNIEVLITIIRYRFAARTSAHEYPIPNLGYPRIVLLKGYSPFFLPLSRSWVDSARRAWCMLRTQSPNTTRRVSAILEGRFPICARGLIIRMKPASANSHAAN
jgi:hypothetical protein